MSNIKRPPIPIIINLILLAAGYVYCSYALVKGIIKTNNYLTGGIPLVPLVILTTCIIGIYNSILRHHVRSILFLGTVLWLIGVFCFRLIIGRDCFSIFYLALAIIFWIIGISFIIWSNLIFEKDGNSPENISAKLNKKQKYWLFSAIAFCVVGVCFGITGNYFEENFRIGYELLKNIMLILMCGLFITSIAQFIIYYILFRIRDFRAKKTNCLEKTGTEST